MPEDVDVPAAPMRAQDATVLVPLMLGILLASVVPVVATLLVVLAAAVYYVLPDKLRVMDDAAGVGR